MMHNQKNDPAPAVPAASAARPDPAGGEEGENGLGAAADEAAEELRKRGDENGHAGFGDIG